METNNYISTERVFEILQILKSHVTTGVSNIVFVNQKTKVRNTFCLKTPDFDFEKFIREERLKTLVKLYEENLFFYNLIGSCHYHLRVGSSLISKVAINRLC